MKDDQKPHMEVASPCTKICTLNADDVCIGCGRSRGEITVWAQASRLQQLQIVDAAARRLAVLTQTTPSTGGTSA